MTNGRTVFLFAHQDDEMAVFREIEIQVAYCRRPVCIYLTNGADNPDLAKRRNAESRRVLNKIGVLDADIYFLGTQLNVPDGELIENLRRIKPVLNSLIGELGRIDRIIMHAWEGGHQDHDAAHLLGFVIASARGIAAQSRQFPLYRASLRRWIPYVVFQPLTENGAVELSKIPFLSAVRFITYCFNYKTQWLAILGLLPLMTFSWIVTRTQKMQPLSDNRITERPHHGHLLYEIRDRYTYESFRKNITEYFKQEAL